MGVAAPLCCSDGCHRRGFPMAGRRRTVYFLSMLLCYLFFIRAIYIYMLSIWRISCHLWFLLFVDTNSLKEGKGGVDSFVCRVDAFCCVAS